jgi:SAM-dependent methyltransferase
MIQKSIGALHQRIVFQRRVLAIANVLKDHLLPGAVLDVGCGNGMISKILMDLRGDVSITGVDTLIRPETFIPTLQYNGTELPFADNSFSDVLLVDVLHHTLNPGRVLLECARVCRGRILVKDHFSENRFNFFLLQLLDWVGNRHHGVVLPFNYFSRRKWETMLSENRIQEDKRTEKIPGLYPLFFQNIIGEKIQFMAVLTHS